MNEKGLNTFLYYTDPINTQLHKQLFFTASGSSYIKLLSNSTFNRIVMDHFPARTKNKTKNKINKQKKQTTLNAAETPFPFSFYTLL